MDETCEDPQELGQLLREAARRSEGADLRGASETLERARAVVAAPHGEAPGAASRADRMAPRMALSASDGE